MSERVPCTGVVIVAAGSGTRLGMGIPKAFVPVAGASILTHALRGLVDLPGRVAVVIVGPPGDDERRAIAEDALDHELWIFGERLVGATVVDGGASRHASVRAGLGALPAACDVVLVHDAARALTPPEQFTRVAGAVRATGHGVVPGLPVVDTIKRVDASAYVLDTVDREALRAMQTPQGFPFAGLVRAYDSGAGEATDDAGTFAAGGGVVEVIAGDPDAFKITTLEDLAAAERLIARRALCADPAPRQHELRVGVGTDVHAFDEISPCWLAGIHFPGERGLSGHSDGDAASHAIVDALLGAAGLGSIGSVFGTADPRYRNAHGAEFLRGTRQLLADRGCTVQNVSVQVVCRRPRFGDRALEAGEVLSEALGAPVSVSATTSDGLGFTGDANEGVFAVATALVAVPATAI
ncbi:2-C-methyl-D-erythritol 4-phosphate cytidylyltransferase [Gulosibacter molinativorax]|uniref:Multifunctional fusion protein n=1 Tax=Gulosibacter molinativorax TaxID=256821 RepID=A0ABT7C408_9MICO|nr:2-C-methyl-D-erythritol 4-phosphate cytidylyltransferase [Gulosibacter molinativorax]MDJ1369950.1 2-C-methyl-D-erythritol 2,4-cyclodiphosphate synthase [Gulosibacter molinativorax]